MPINTIFLQLNTPMNLWLTSILFFVLALSSITVSAAEPEPVGHISFSRGGAAVSHEGKPLRLIGENADIFEGDNIQTGERSFVIISFKDDSKVTVRPNSSFSVNQFSPQATSQKVELELHKGGIRTSNIDVPSSKADSFQVKTPSTTITTQQADYSVRICNEDCVQSTDSNESKPVHKQEAIARIVTLRGLVVATSQKSPSAPSRPLTLGSPVYNSDILKSEKGAYAVLVFKDKGRITLEESSSFAVKDYSFKNNKSEDKAIYKLIKGGMRVLTGKIGKTNKQSFSIETPVATIGIRGTGFDLFFSSSEGLYSSVWLGTITQTNDSGMSELSLGSAALINSLKTQPKPVALSELPNSKVNNTAPRPDKVEVNNENELFPSTNTPAPGTYVDVHEGTVQIDQPSGGKAVLNKNESSFTNQSSQTVVSNQSPSIIQSDPYSLPADFNLKDAKTGGFSLLNSDGLTPKSNNGKAHTFQCAL